MKQLGTALLLASALSAAQADSYEDGMRYLSAKAYTSAVTAFRMAAADGSAVAQRQLGFMYYRGLGLAQSDAEALAWFERAATRGDLQSQVNLGQMYENGLSVAHSDSRSAYWYGLAAGQGDRGSQVRYGEILYLGTGVPQDRSEAIKWWLIAMRTDDHTTTQIRSMIESALSKIPPDVQGEGKRRAEAWLTALNGAR